MPAVRAAKDLLLLGNTSNDLVLLALLLLDYYPGLVYSNCLLALLVEMLYCQRLVDSSSLMGPILDQAGPKTAAQSQNHLPRAQQLLLQGVLMSAELTEEIAVVRVKVFELVLTCERRKRTRMDSMIPLYS